MKKRIMMLAFVAMGMMALTSCQKDTKELILGTWDVIPESSYMFLTSNGETEKYPIKGELTMTFKEDGTLILTQNQEERKQSYTIDGKKLVVNGINGEILTLTKNELVFELSQEVTDNGVTGIVGEHYELSK